MNTSIDLQNCKNFRRRDLCPKKDNETLIDLDDLVIPGNPKSPTSLSDIFEKARAVCAGCDQFEPLR